MRSLGTISRRLNKLVAELQDVFMLKDWHIKVHIKSVLGNRAYADIHPVLKQARIVIGKDTINRITLLHELMHIAAANWSHKVAQALESIEDQHRKMVYEKLVAEEEDVFVEHMAKVLARLPKIDELCKKYGI